MTSAILLAGGASRRMGEDKRFLTYKGQPLLERAIDLLRPIAEELIVTVRKGDGALLPTQKGVRWMADRKAFAGPLTAIAHAIPHCRSEYIIVQACDMPQVTTEALQHLLNTARGHECDVCIPVVGAHRYELPSVFAKGNEQRLMAYLESGKRSIRGYYKRHDVCVVSAELSALQPRTDWVAVLSNWNDRAEVSC